LHLNAVIARGGTPMLYIATLAHSLFFLSFYSVALMVTVASVLPDIKSPCNKEKKRVLRDHK